MRLPRNGRGTLVSMVLAVAVLDGCRVGPDFKTPEATVPPTWSLDGDPRVAAQAATDSLWWKEFNDASLDRLVDLAYRQNLSLQIAGLRIAEARAQLGVATGMQFPQMQQLTASYTAYNLGRNTANVASFDRTFGAYQVGFDAAWELDFWGKFGRGVEAQAAALLASVADYYSAIVSLTAEVARTYVMIRTFEALIDLARQNVRVQQDALDVAQSRFRNGATSELDPAQATTLLESTRATIPQLQIELDQAHDALATLLGQPPNTLGALLAGPAEIPKAPAAVAVGMPAEILRRRPDIRSAELNAASQCARIGIAKADLYPSFSLVGTIGLGASTAGPSGNLLSSDSIYYAAGPQINWPILNYGRITNGVRVQDARFEGLLVGYRNAVLKAAQEVEDALTGYLNAQRVAAQEQAAVTAAQRAVEIALVQYREGATDYQRVIDAQRSLLQQQDALAQATSSIATYVIALYKALGGGWEVRAGQPLLPEPMRREMKDRTNWGDLLSEPRSPERQTSAPTGNH